MDYEIIHPKLESLPYLVFIHGAGGGKTQWNYQKDFFVQKKYGIITLDLPGHGVSPLSIPVTISSYAEEITELLESLSIENFVLIGHSMGGAIILKYLLSNPKNTPQLSVFYHYT